MSNNVLDPLELKEMLWPQIHFYKEERDIIYSVVHNKETYVPAANRMGKDFTAAFIIVWFFLTRHPCRIVTTSAKGEHLKVLFGEVGRFIQLSRIPLSHKLGGPLIVQQEQLKIIPSRVPWLNHYYGPIRDGGEHWPASYVIGMVAAEDTVAGMQGHHASHENILFANDGIPRTLFVPDESSGVPNSYYDMAQSWMQRMLSIGNTWDCNNFFKYSIKGNPKTNDRGGDILNPDGQSYHRKVIRIRAEDSPNVKLGLLQESRGEVPTNEILVPGVKSYFDYKMDRKLLDKVQQSVKLDAQFYEGAENLLYPPLWLDHADELYEKLRGRRRRALAIGIDPAQGGDNTAMAAVDEYGLIELVSKKTPDTSVITDEAIWFMKRHDLHRTPTRVVLDVGGGGKQHADRLRKMGYNVRTVAFGEVPTLEVKRAKQRIVDKKEVKEDRRTFKNRSAEMAGELSTLLDPSGVGNELLSRWLRKSVGHTASSHEWSSYLGPYEGFALPLLDYNELRRQMAPIPKKYDENGVMFMLPKQKKEQDQDIETLTDLLGSSPDEYDALRLACFGMLHPLNAPVSAGGGVQLERGYNQYVGR